MIFEEDKLGIQQGVLNCWGTPSPKFHLLTWSVASEYVDCYPKMADLKKIVLQLRQWGKDQVKKKIYTFYISNFIFAGFLEVKEDI